MTAVRADWTPNPEFPDELRATVRIARPTYPAEDCTLKFVDHVAPSGTRYISVEVHAPYQGRGLALHLEVNGVALSLDWNGGNEPPFPARTKHADYRREGLTPEQADRLREVPPA